MTTSTRNTPQLDPGSEPAELDTAGQFRFEIGDETYVMPNRTVDTITFGFMRAHKDESPSDYMISVLEALAGTGPEGRRILAALDKLTQPQVRTEITPLLNDHLGTSLGG